MSDNERFPAGWAMPVLGVGVGPNAKAHYYSAGVRGASLCGKYVMLGGTREDFAHDSPDNCKRCKDRLRKQRPELFEAAHKACSCLGRGGPFQDDGKCWICGGYDTVERLKAWARWNEPVEFEP